MVINCQRSRSLNLESFLRITVYYYLMIEMDCACRVFRSVNLRYTDDDDDVMNTPVAVCSE